MLSARAIPGNEKAISRVMNHVTRRGADIVTESMKHVHVSGHGSEEELKLMLSLVRPRYLVPVHGEYRQLAHHKRVAERVTGNTGHEVEVLLIENGDVLRFDRAGAGVVAKAPTGRVLIDGSGVGEVGDEVLRDRRHLAVDGLALPIVAISKDDGSLASPPEIITRGFVTDPGDESLLADGGADARRDDRAHPASRSGPIPGCCGTRCGTKCGASCGSDRGGARWCCPSSWRSEWPDLPRSPVVPVSSWV